MIGAPYIPSWPQLSPFAGELCLIAAISIVLLVPFFLRRSNLASAVVAIVGLVSALVAMLLSGWEMPAEKPLGLLVSDPAAMLWKMMLFVFVLGIIMMWLSTTRHTMHEGDGPEFFTLILGATLGMSLMASTTNLLMLVIAVEMASLPSYILAGFRKTHRLGAEASLKYVLFGAACSGIMVYGLSMLYGLYGTLELGGNGGIAWNLVHHGGYTTLSLFAFVALLVGLGFKISAVPFHFWCPDVFEGASIEVSAFLSVASKGAALMLLTRVLMVVADAAGYSAGASLSLVVPAIIIGIVGAITCTVGNTAAFAQNNIKRLLAYSSIAHAGYMLCGLSLLVNGNANIIAAGGENVVLQMIMVYLLVYLFMNLGAFTAAGVVARMTGTEELHGFRDLGRRAPLLAAALAVCLFSLVGLPPLAGFWAKLNLLVRLVANGGWWWALVAVIAVNTVISLYYYARILRAMYLEKTEEPSFEPPAAGSGLALACAAVLLILFIGSNWMNNITAAAAHLAGTVAR